MKDGEASLKDMRRMWNTLAWKPASDAVLMLQNLCDAVGGAGMWCFIQWVCRALPAQRRMIERQGRAIDEIQKHLGIDLQSRMHAEQETNFEP